MVEKMVWTSSSGCASSSLELSLFWLDLEPEFDLVRLTAPGRGADRVFFVFGGDGCWWVWKVEDEVLED